MVIVRLGASGGGIIDAVYDAFLQQVGEAIYDVDNDGLMDGWETGEFGGVEAYSEADDPDDDRLSNAAEFVAGTDPNIASSKLNLAARPVSGGMEVSCETLPATEVWYNGKTRYYTLESAPSLSGPWTGVSGAMDVPGTGTPLTRIVVSDGSAQFVRVRVLLQ